MTLHDIGIKGVLAANISDPKHRTGCTVVLFPEGTIASGEVRGGAPATREFALLDPLKTVSRLDAVVLSGGSAFGLRAAEGVVDFCAAAGRGFDTPGGKVPIVVGLSLYDLTEGDGSVRPTAADGRAAAVAAGDRLEIGRVGAGTGATVAKWRGKEHARPGGLGAATVRRDDVVVTAIVAVNAAGEIDDGVAARQIRDGTFEWPPPVAPFAGDAQQNTSIGIVITNAIVDKLGCALIAQSGHNGYARALFPAHTRSDGDALVAAATQECEASLDVVRILATVAVDAAIRSVAT